ncbi:MAG: glycosyltransferase family 39 protein [Bacteroidetes bacterium]|nr:glycosyltransferase family 39 protein [Bacteroidota bacterium]
MNISKKQILLIAFVIFVANFILKLIHIGSSSLWYDEIISCNDTQLFWGHIKHEAEWDKNPPFYHYALWIWSKFFGKTEIALRSMSAFFSALTGVVLFLFSNKFFNFYKAISISIVFISHHFLFYYAQEARCYSLLIFLVISNIFYTYYYIKNQTFLNCIILGLLNFLIFYTHYIAGLILFCQFIFVLLVIRVKFSHIIAIYSTSILLVLLRFTKKQYKVLFMSHEMSSQKQNVPLSNFYDLQSAISNLYIDKIIFIAIVVLILFKIFTTYKFQIKDKINVKFEYYLIFTPIICISLLYGLGLLTNVFNERYLIFTTPFILLSIIALINHNHLFAITCLIISVFSFTKIEFGKSRQMDYRMAANITKIVQKQHSPAIILQTHDIQSLFYYYYNYNGYLNQNWKNNDKLKAENIFIIENNYELKQLITHKNKSILFFQTFANKTDRNQIDSSLKMLGYKNLYRRNVSNNIILTAFY